jgi:2'-5' RNA ligase
VTSDRTPPDATRRWRLFVALPVPEGAASAIMASLGVYRRVYPDARWLRPDQLHVTVRFLGGTDPAAVPVIAHAIAQIAREAGPIELATGPGAGDDRRRRGDGVAWLTLLEGRAAVHQLATGLDPRLPLEALASPLRPPPQAHVTIARHAPSGLIGALRDELLGLTRLAWTADRIVLFRSHAGTPAGPTYEPLAESLLATRAPR